ncbi:MAG: hypothetical protein KatS3mg062_1385 [Tepidiforma sp.]|nr:MAG: hypothetical protein KatS3mg062_1385 [Tepidiforma sp.]
MLTRRQFVRGAVSLVSIGTTSHSLLKGAVAFAGMHPESVRAAGADRVLVLVQLAGGNDGLNTVVPFADGAYRSARTTLAVPEGEVLPIGDGMGFHSSMQRLHELWQRGKLAVVQGVGYPNQNYSHFKSMAIWQAGDPEVRLDTGWLGRTLEALEDAEHDPFLGFNVGTAPARELYSPEVAVPTVSDPDQYGVAFGGETVPGTDPRVRTLMKLYEQYPAASPHGVLLETTAETAVASAELLREAHQRYTPAVTYPETSFGAGLQVLAEAIVGGLGMRVGHITLGGFDTHSDQADRHVELLQTLDEGLAAFYADLAAQGHADRVMVLTWSEFGRRVAENANGGTDHGAASVVFALGGQVRGGLYGERPRLDQLVDNGNLGYTTDFRRVYATVIENWFGVPHEPLMGQRWEPLGFASA